VAAISMRDRIAAAAERTLTRLVLYVLVVMLGSVAFVAMIATAAIAVYPSTGWVGAAGVIAAITSVGALTLCVVAQRLDRSPTFSKAAQDRPSVQAASPVSPAPAAPTRAPDPAPPTPAYAQPQAAQHQHDPESEPAECPPPPPIPIAWIAAGSAAALGIAFVVGPVRLVRFAARGLSTYVTIRRLTAALTEETHCADRRA